MKEGSFHGHIDELDFEEGWGEIKTQKVLEPNLKPPTPDQLPNRIDLTNIPESVLRTNVIESLINQNDDLMSRLTVSLRRIASLEDKLSTSQTETLQFRSKYENLKDQVLILKEQSRNFIARAKSAEKKTLVEEKSISELKEQIKVLEIRYAELSQSLEEREAKILQKSDRTIKENRRLAKYRRNVRRAIAIAKQELRTLREKRGQLDQALADLKNNLSETTQYISTTAKEHKLELANLTQAYELQLKELRSEIEMLIQQNQVLGERSRDAEKLYNEKIKVENDLIISQRKFEELEIRTASEVADVQKTLARYKNDAAHLALEHSTHTQLLKEQNDKIDSLTLENKNFSEQVETLQLLWREQQNQLEKSNEQKNSLQKLNQELSLAINQYRRDIKELKAQNESLEQRLRSQSDNKTKAQSMTQKSLTSSDIPSIKREDELTPEIMSKIDKALSSLHTS